MAASFHTKKIKEASPIICRTLTTTTRRKPTMSSNLSISYFKPKIRIKVPKLIAKIMQKRCRQCIDDHSKNKKKWAKQVGSVFSGVMGKRKSVDACSSNDRNEEVYRKTAMNKVGSETLKSEKDTTEGMQKRNGKVKSSIQPRVANKLPTKKFLSFTSFFNRKNRKNFIKGNINKENDSCSICDGCSTPNCRTVGGVTTSFRLIGKQGSSGHLIRVPSKILTTRKKLRVARSLRKKMNKQFERGSEEENDGKDKEEKGELELCKKRILMGEKCRPLGFSGTLQYDKDGILLPEVLGEDYRGSS
ncbi:uncharacterized protein LOC126716884 [Quercus robur]|uniref:uncharacterized protein LOC126716884 n=1 Tax=Quercus robur TaxID=38942 RepID=UPI00216169EC|nr:uncharacterized protein LOC126716884 [Quercus robur]